MIKKILIIVCTITSLMANSENISLMNSVKTVIQKEEYIALAVNKYIAQTGQIPKTSNNKLDWDRLIKNDILGDYLTIAFDNKNPLTAATFDVVFNRDNSLQIKGVFSSVSDYQSNYKYLYDFYINKLFRINTIPPKSNDKSDLVKGSNILYGKFQKDIVKVLTDATYEIKLPSEQCSKNNYYYELRNQKVVYKYCKADGTSFDIYQKTPVYLEDWNDLSYIKATVGDKAYVKKNGQWYEYIYQGDVEVPWIPVEFGSSISNQDSTLNIEDRLLSYIPGAKDLVIRRDGGCMLANGDIYCWGNNDFKKAGISSYGQLDHNLSPDYVNTPVMLKVQLEANSTQRIKMWYNNPYRIKFEKMSMNSTNVCAVSASYDYEEAGVSKKYGGDLYCNGQIDYKNFEDMVKDIGKSSILKRNIFFSTGKDDKLNDSNEIYLKDIAMVEDTIAVLSDDGKIYTFGRNYKGALGINSTDKFMNQSTPSLVDSALTFKKIFALRDIKCFGAIDSNNQFWIWGERPNGTIYYKPTLVASGKTFNPDMIFINSSDFILRGTDNIYYRTHNDATNIVSLNGFIPSSALSASIYEYAGGTKFYYLYVDENMQLKGSSSLTQCREADESSSCSESQSKIFSLALEELNTKSNANNGKSYANFANVGIYKLDHVITDVWDNFDNGNIDGWQYYKDGILEDMYLTNSVDDGTAGRIPVTNFLGRYTIGNTAIEKTYDLGSFYANKEVEVEFDFFEIDSWDMEIFNVELNGVIMVKDNFVHDFQQYFLDTKDSGELLQNVGSLYTSNEKFNDYTYRYKLKSKLDSSGKLKVRFSTRIPQEGELGYLDENGDINYWGVSLIQSLDDESWGVDNIHIKVKETDKKFVCAMTGLRSSSQMYCWGNIARSAPIINTSLYDESKTSTINKLFITEEKDAKKQMSYDKYYNGGKLFLKYPTYIGGFDYEFYFK
ncbi:MAG: hypothetical protein ACNI28_09730 [Arcobacter sp.]|uniref:hypothetical protein n=1 Tax=Arcobacter sp. TaxID=1872629 RepID=UPI003AFFE916